MNSITYGPGTSQFAKALSEYTQWPLLRPEAEMPISIDKGIFINHNGLISYIDFKDDYRPHKTIGKLLKIGNLHKILKCQFRPNAIRDDRVVPFTYFVKDMKKLMLIKDYCPKLRYNKLFFKGTIWDKRKLILKHLYKICNQDNKRTLGVSEYYKECLRHIIGLSLPGHGNFCYREIEYFALGVATIMPKLKNTTHNNLVPNVHYYPVEVADSKTTAENITKAFYKLNKNEALRNEITKNAYQWFNDNVAFPNSCKLACQILGL